MPVSGAQENGPVVAFDNVGLRYGTGPEVLHDLSFTIEPGSFQFLTGPSGAGKTTLIRLVLMLLSPSRGLIRIFGREVADALPGEVTLLRRRMGAVFQDFRLLPHLSTFDNVALPLRVQGRDATTYRAEVSELLDWVGLGRRASALPATLSGGEKQRAAIARALIARPELIIADEPTGNVDPALARRLLRLFTELNRHGTSVVFATHDLSLMERFDAPRMILEEGRLWVSA